MFENPRKKSHSILRANWAYILKLIKNVKNGQFWRFFKNLKKSNATLWVIFKQCGHVKTSSRILPSTVTESFAFLHALKKSHGFVKEKINLEKDVKALWNFLCQISSLKSNQLFYLLAIVFDSLLPGLLRERFWCNFSLKMLLILIEDFIQF